MIDFSRAEKETIASDEDVMSFLKRLIAQNKEAYEVQIMSKNRKNRKY